MNDGICSIPDCTKPVHKKSWCTTHYARWYKHGDPNWATSRIPTGAICSIAGCSAPQKSSKGWCRKHYLRAQRNNGNPLGGRTLDGEPKAYFEKQLFVVTDECKTWPYNTDHYGYGILRVGAHHRKVHRLACEAFYGPPGNESLEAAHGFDQPCTSRACFNGFHLAWKTRQKNSDDRSRDGTLLSGQKHPGARFTDDEVIQIRQRYSNGETRADIAREYDVVYNTIDLIVRRLSWKHL
jgi:hypothetical protein